MMPTEYGYTYDENGHVLTYKGVQSGYWCVYTRDWHGNVLSHIDSSGEWYKFTRDEAGKILTYEDCDGDWYKLIRDEAGEIVSKESGVREPSEFLS